MTDQENTTESLIVGSDAKLYVRRTIGSEDAPVASVVLPAPPHMLPKTGVKGPELTMLNFPKLSLDNIVFTHAYFQAVYEEHQSEAIVLFHRAPDDTEYTVVVPESYSASSGHVSYEPMQIKFCDACKICVTDDAVVKCPHCLGEAMTYLSVMGTAHSHGSMSAFHSGTDDEHELNQTGFHITFGHVQNPLVDICPSFVVALCGMTNEKGKGTRFMTPLQELIELPLEEEATNLVSMWKSLVVSGKKLYGVAETNDVVLDGDGTLLLIENKPGEAAQWCSVQSSERGLRITTVSAHRELIKAANQKNASKPGSTPNSSNRPPLGGTRAPGTALPPSTSSGSKGGTAGQRSGPAGSATNQQVGQKHLLLANNPSQGNSQKTGTTTSSETSGSTKTGSETDGAITALTEPISMHLGAEEGEFILRVDDRAISGSANDLICFVPEKGETLTMWGKFFEKVGAELGCVALLYAATSIKTILDGAADAFINDNDVLKKLSDVEELLEEIFGMEYTYPKDFLDGYVMDPKTDKHSPTERIDDYVAHIREQQVPVEALTVGEADREGTITAAFGTVYTLWALKNLLDVGRKNELITTECIATLLAAIKSSTIAIYDNLYQEQVLDEYLTKPTTTA